jgi:hypothetical protein
MGLIHLNAIKIPSNVVMVKAVTVLDKQVNTSESGKSSLDGKSRDRLFGMRLSIAFHRHAGAVSQGRPRQLP